MKRNITPYEITARFDSTCAETGKPIRKGDKAIYYPIGRKTFHVDSKQASAFYAWKMDEAMGFSY